MNSSKDKDTGFVAIAALRYCHRKKDYAPELVTDWVLRYWDSIPRDEQTEIKRETINYIDSNCNKKHNHNLQIWKDFNNKIRNTI
jgi:hypothetical protein